MKRDALKLQHEQKAVDLTQQCRQTWAGRAPNLDGDLQDCNNR
jgi:hypothetical protein